MIRSIFRFFFKSFFWISALLGALIIFLGLYAYFKEAQPNVMAVPNNALLTVELSDGFVEHKDGNLLQELFMGKQKSLFDLTQGFYNAAADERIKAVAIYLTSPGLDLLRFRKFGMLYKRLGRLERKSTCIPTPWAMERLGIACTTLLLHAMRFGCNLLVLWV